MSTKDIKPTHRCTTCGALWKRWKAGEAFPGSAASWQLRSDGCGKCCDNGTMITERLTCEGDGSHQEARKLNVPAKQQMFGRLWRLGALLNGAEFPERDKALDLLFGAMSWEPLIASRD